MDLVFIIDLFKIDSLVLLYMSHYKLYNYHLSKPILKFLCYSMN